jgi:Protein of unknown function (DUF3667)
MEHVTPAICGNCDAPLAGPYCSQCGQHAHESARSLTVVLHDGWHLMTHIDSRFWSTIRILMSTPGQLTLDYFADRRARHVSPLQLYFVLSIAFFALTAANSNSTPVAAAPMAAAAAAPRETTQSAVDVSIDAGDCGKIDLGWPWLQARLRTACQREVADNGKSAAHAFGSYVPKMMFVFLPLMALIMLPLYLAPRHYYVEHLVFFLHAHAALFLLLIGDLLLGIAAHRLPHLGVVATVGDFAAACYAAWYVYRAMRRYYGNGRALTLAKLAVVGIAYQLFLAIMVAATLLLSALTA